MRSLYVPGARPKGSSMRGSDVVLSETLMRRALELAALGPAVDPNPRVGAVVTATDGRVVGEGFHRGAGHPHAEVEALALAGANAYGGTAWVTLEPCDHTGRTGPCSRGAAGCRGEPGGVRSGRSESGGGGWRGPAAGGRCGRRGWRVGRGGARAQPGLDVCGDPRPSSCGVEVRGDLGRTICCRRRHQSVDHRTGGSSGCAPPPGASRGRSWWVPGPCSPTIRR